MSKDMMMFVERRIDHRWIPADTLVRIPEKNGGGIEPKSYNIGGNAQLYAVLNCYDQHMDYIGEPITSNRGCPPDISTELMAWVEKNKYDIREFHTSWMAMNDLLTFDWHRQMSSIRDMTYEDFVGGGSVKEFLDIFRLYPHPESLRVIVFVI